MADYNSFIGALLALWRRNYCADIDGCDFQDLLIKHGLASEGTATEADCEEEPAQEFGVEPGDPMLKYHPDLMALMKEQ